MAGQLTIDTLKASTGVLATQNGMTGIAKAWVKFNGITNTINGSFNIASITKNATGDYTITFSTAMPDANYSSSYIGRIGTDSTAPYPASFYQWLSDTTTTTQYRFRTCDAQGTFFDYPTNYLIFVGN